MTLSPIPARRALARRAPLALLAFLLAAALAMDPAVLVAQQRPGSPPPVPEGNFRRDAPTREERITQHEQRVREIIEQRRQERMQQIEAQQRDPSVGGRPVEAREQRPAEPAPGPSISLGRPILYNQFRNPITGGRELDTVVRAGERFVSEVMLQNEGNDPFDRVQIALRFDKRFIEPVRIFDTQMRPLAAEPPRFEIDQRDSIIIYDIKLAEPHDARETTVLTIVWEATRQTEFASLSFQFAQPGAERASSHHTAVSMGGRNILGDPRDPMDGVLSGSILVMQPFQLVNDASAQMLQGKREELEIKYLESIGSNVPVGLRLVGPEQPPAVGQDFDVDLVLENPFGAVIDHVRLFILFDPSVLQVVDTDRGNWIRIGTNIADGPFRRDFPWEFHNRNEVDNTRGRIQYSKGLGRQLALPTGTFARITFRAIRPVAETEVQLVRTRDSLDRVTAVQSFGFDLFNTHPRLTQPVVATPIFATIEERTAAVAAAIPQYPRDDPRNPEYLPPHLFLPQLLMPPEIPEHLKGQNRL